MPKADRKSRSYALGLDYGTLSARAVLVDTHDGKEIATAVAPYPHGVIETNLPGSKTRLQPETALQHPGDYLAVLPKIVRGVLKQSSISPSQVAGVGIDFTSCTMLPAAENGTPLCLDRKWSKNPHSWTKLWKHHAAQPEATAINEQAAKSEPELIRTYGGSYSSEWFFSKLLETVRKAPEVYDAAAFFLEGGDWLAWQLCGRQTRNVSAAGFKAMRVLKNERGDWDYPPDSYFVALNPRLHNVRTKLDAPIAALGEKVGELLPEIAKQIGLPAGIPVAAANIDAHSAVPACGVTGPGKMVMIMGTSTCHMLIGDSRVDAEGICGVVEDGIVPGAWGYEAGQPGVGDLFAWFVERVLRGASTHERLEQDAAKLKPGASGLVALDWWNGNRSVLSNSQLSGLIAGLTLSTQPAELYRALLEATAFGTRKIIEAFTSKGIDIHELIACGGLAHKSPLLLQIYADVAGRTVRVASSQQASALGAAMHAAVAGGVYPSIQAAAQKMARIEKRAYQPRPGQSAVYQELYAAYGEVHDYFGRGTNRLMIRLKEIRNRALGFA